MYNMYVCMRYIYIYICIMICERAPPRRRGRTAARRRCRPGRGAVLNYRFKVVHIQRCMFTCLNICRI